MAIISNGRHLVPPAVIAGQADVLVGLEVLAQRENKVVDEGQADNQREASPATSRVPPVACHASARPEIQTRTIGRVHDTAHQAALHDLKVSLCRDPSRRRRDRRTAAAGRAVRHPGDDATIVQGLQDLESMTPPAVESALFDHAEEALPFVDAGGKVGHRGLFARRPLLRSSRAAVASLLSAWLRRAFAADRSARRSPGRGHRRRRAQRTMSATIRSGVTLSRSRRWPHAVRHDADGGVDAAGRVASRMMPPSTWSSSAGLPVRAKRSDQRSRVRVKSVAVTLTSTVATSAIPVRSAVVVVDTKARAPTMITGTMTDTFPPHAAT